MTATLPLEIAPSLRLVLVGDTGVGKSKASSLFLSSVPGQFSSDLANDGVANLNINDESTTTAEEEQQEQDPFCTRGVVSTLKVPAWLKVQHKSESNTVTANDDNDGDNELALAENIVLHDFVGYGQTLDANQTIERIEAFLTEQYMTTRQLFGSGITPLSTLGDSQGAANSLSKPSFLEQLLVDSPMSHSLPDACLYFILYDLKPVDIEFMQRIMRHVNLIPVLAKADTLSVSQLWKTKARILKQLEDSGIDFFQFGFTIEELKEMAHERMAGGPPFALSSTQLEQQQQQQQNGGGGGFLVSTPQANLTDLATAINGGEYAETRSDQSLLQALLLGNKNLMLHQASVKKFLNRWKADLGIPIEDPRTQPNHVVEASTTTMTIAAEVEESGAVVAASSDSNEVNVHDPQENQSAEVKTPVLEQASTPRISTEPATPTTTTTSTTTSTTTTSPIPSSSIASTTTTSSQVSQTKLPASLQQSTYQPTSSYTSYQQQGATDNNNMNSPDNEVAQVIKLNRQRSFIRAASPSTKIYTPSGSIVPPVPVPSVSVSASGAAGSLPNSPSLSPPLASGAGVTSP
ncbi:hypothetical protein BG004_002286 [Podila humilis]|nr:hypothetical protein BG004_002286 [Podila humilis]